jgi:regulator of protease activity HflC (stomatin/prohibitin superfamily)
MYAQLIGLLAFATLGFSAMVSSVKVVRQGDQALVEFLGKYEGKKLEPGLTFLTPFIEYVAFKDTLREQLLEMPPTQCMTSDRLNVNVDFVIYWKVSDLEKACYKVQDLKAAMLNLLLVSIRSQIATMESEEILTGRKTINDALVEELDVATEPWGIKVTRVELRDFTLGGSNNSQNVGHFSLKKAVS